MSGSMIKSLKKERGGRFSKWEMDEKFESSEKGFEGREDNGLSRKIIRTEE